MRKLVLIFLFISSVAMGQTPMHLLIAKKATAAITKYCRSITVDKTKVPNTDQTDFPVLVSGVYSYLATVANGGKVRDAQGDDIIFYTGGCGVETLLNWEIEKWNATTGEIQAWVKVPTLTTATNYVFYIGYGDAARTTFAGNITGTWNSAFKGVWHGNNASSPALDATTNAYNATQANGVTFGATGQIDGALTLDGVDDLLTLGSVTSHNFVQNTLVFTITAWVKFASNTARQCILGSSSGATNGFFFEYENSGGQVKNLRLYVGTTSGTPVIEAITGNNVITDANWHRVAVKSTATGNNVTFYVDNTAQTTTYPNNYNALATGNSATTPAIGAINNASPVLFFNGTIDEVRISNVARAADWLTTEYNNQSSPSTFYTVGSETGL